MFDKLIRELENLNGKQISIPIESDEEGYLDKECPREECKFQFKTKEEDWKNIFKDESVFCPMCGENAPAKSFFTTEQVENAREQGHKYIRGKIDKALKEGAEDFNRRQNRNSFISMSMKVTGTNPVYYILPILASKEFERKFKCNECQSNYSVIGSAFFCPSCGDNSVEQTVDESLNKVQIKLNNIPTIRKAIESINKDEAEITCRSIIETGLSDCVVSFQRFCEATYKKMNPSEKVTSNVFQRLDEGSKLWKKVFGEDYQSWLSESDYNKLNTLFQKRHLLAHSEGLVDEKYLQRANDKTYKLGQRIIVSETDVKSLLKLVISIIEKIRTLRVK